jgi:DNA-binding NarL/FixJ family response regulator
MKPGKQKRTLIVSDSPLVGDRLVNRLSVLERVTIMDRLKGEDEALRFTAAHNPDVVVVDTHLETGNGMTLIRRIKELWNAPTVIVVSTLATKQYARKGIKEGADYFFKLPQEIEELVELMDGRKK